MKLHQFVVKTKRLREDEKDEINEKKIFNEIEEGMTTDVSKFKTSFD